MKHTENEQRHKDLARVLRKLDAFERSSRLSKVIVGPGKRKRKAQTK